MAVDGRNQRPGEVLDLVVREIARNRGNFANDDASEFRAALSVFVGHLHGRGQAMVVNRHPQITVVAGEAEISFDQSANPILAGDLELREQMSRPLLKGPGIDRQQKVIEAGEDVVNGPDRVTDRSRHLPRREAGKAVLGHLPVPLVDDQRTKFGPAMIRSAAHRRTLCF